MTLSITIKVDNEELATINEIPYKKSMNGQQEMETGYDLHQDEASNFSLRYFGSQLGYEVTTLDRLSQQIGSDANTYLFWELLINGGFSQHGVDSTFPNDGDDIEWNYTRYTTERHAGTRYDKVRSTKLVGGRGTPSA